MIEEERAGDIEDKARGQRECGEEEALPEGTIFYQR